MSSMKPIPFEEIDERLSGLGLTREWLAKAAQRQLSSIVAALCDSENPSKRSKHLQWALTSAIALEELRREIGAQKNRAKQNA